jgi:hypothetical protein
MNASTAVVTCIQRGKAVIGWQLEMFGATDPLVGIELNLPRHCQCGHDVLRLGPGRGTHRASLRCAHCWRHCGWLSNESAKFISSVIEHFGRPTTPVCMHVSRGALP